MNGKGRFIEFVYALYMYAIYYYIVMCIVIDVGFGVILK